VTRRAMSARPWVEAGADEQHTLEQFLDFFKKWEQYENRRPTRPQLGE